MFLRQALSTCRLASSVSCRLQHRTMASFTTTHNIPVQLPDGLSEDQLKSFKPFTVSRQALIHTSYINDMDTGS